MREIKFRVWTGNQMLHITHEAELQLNFGINDGWALWEPYGELCTHKDGELMQSTGLKDKNGVEIYEGDIVRYLDAYMHGEDGDWDECECVGQVKWDDELAQFYVKNRQSMDNEDFWEQINEAEVIGNFHQHPHLIK